MTEKEMIFRADRAIASGAYEKAWQKEREEEEELSLHGVPLQLPERVEVGGRWVETEGLRPLCYTDGTERPGPVLLDIHGGGFVEGTPGADDELCHFFHKRLNIVVVSLDYRKAPAFPYPAALEDIAAQISWLCRERPWGIEPEQIFLMGHSAGGNLAAAYCLLAAGKGLAMPAVQILNYPYLDLQMSCLERPDLPEAIDPYLMEVFRRAYDGGQGRTGESLMSPACAKPRELAGLPPAHLITCGRDSLCPEGKRYGEKLKEAGVPVEELYLPQARHGFIEHCFNSRSRFEPAAGQRELAVRAVKQLAQWLEERMEERMEKRTGEQTGVQINVRPDMPAGAEKAK